MEWKLLPTTSHIFCQNPHATFHFIFCFFLAHPCNIFMFTHNFDQEILVNKTVPHCKCGEKLVSQGLCPLPKPCLQKNLPPPSKNDSSLSKERRFMEKQSLLTSSDRESCPVILMSWPDVIYSGWVLRGEEEWLTCNVGNDRKCYSSHNLVMLFQLTFVFQSWEPNSESSEAQNGREVEGNKIFFKMSLSPFFSGNRLTLAFVCQVMTVTATHQHPTILEIVLECLASWQMHLFCMVAQWYNAW